MYVYNMCKCTTCTFKWTGGHVVLVDIKWIASSRYSLNDFLKLALHLHNGLCSPNPSFSPQARHVICKSHLTCVCPFHSKRVNQRTSELLCISFDFALAARISFQPSERTHTIRRGDDGCQCAYFWQCVKWASYAETQSVNTSHLISDTNANTLERRSKPPTAHQQQNKQKQRRNV